MELRAVSRDGASRDPSAEVQASCAAQPWLPLPATSTDTTSPPGQLRRFLWWALGSPISLPVRPFGSMLACRGQKPDGRHATARNRTLQRDSGLGHEHLDPRGDPVAVHRGGDAGRVSPDDDRSGPPLVRPLDGQVENPEKWEPEVGFEPTTCCLQDSCSSQLSYPGGWHCSDGRSTRRCGLIVPTAHGPAVKRCVSGCRPLR